MSDPTPFSNDHEPSRFGDYLVADADEFLDDMAEASAHRAAQRQQRPKEADVSYLGGLDF